MYKIYTLGDFDIRYMDKSILDKDKYSFKIMKLFKYFITYEGEKMLPERIIEDLWIDEDYKDPKNTLTTQISRLRNFFPLSEKHGGDFYNIEYINGYYIFKIMDNAILDVRIFEDIINAGNYLKRSNPDDSLLKLKEGISLYKGKYLLESDYEDWLVPIVNRYHRLYVQGLYNYIEILKDKKMNDEIIKAAETAMKYEPYGEELHISFMEALMENGEIEYANNHYRYITSQFYKHLGINPSNKMKNFYLKLKSDKGNKKEEKLLSLQEFEGELDLGDHIKGGLIIEPNYFNLIYNLEKRRIDRKEKKGIYIGIITIESGGFKNLSDNELESIMNKLLSILYEELRKGDIISKWNSKQVACLIYDVDEENINIALNRLNKEIKAKTNNKDIFYKFRFKHI